MEQVDEKEHPSHNRAGIVDPSKQMGKNHQKNQHGFQVVPFGNSALLGLRSWL
ncbi:MAG: hypothetical protein LUD78_06350 [Clostridiales bacterium]|nr:hypothetical protein [Clostridiales bacterium]